MTLFGTKFRFGPVAQAFHWVVAALVIVAWLFPDDMTLHATVGVAVFVLAAVRMAWRSLDRLPGKPPLRSALARWSWRADVLLYALLFIVPITGILGMVLGGHAVELYGFGAVGPSVAISAELGHHLIDLHRLTGNLMILVAGVHSAFALFHHFVCKDGVLRMMLPGGRAA